MKKISLSRKTLCLAVVASASLLSAGAASAQNYGPTYAGASIGGTDFGTGLKVYVGGKVTPIFGWEGQMASLGSEEYAPGRKHSAVSLGASGVARFAISPQFTAFGKAGLHYLRVKYSGQSAGSESDIELGLGAGLLWHVSHTAAVRLEYENIGGGNGDFFSLGVQFSF